MIKTSKNNCPECGNILNAATAITNINVKPKCNDISICYKCGTILKFNKQLHLIKATEKDLEQISTSDLSVLMQIKDEINRIKILN